MLVASEAGRSGTAGRELASAVEVDAPENDADEGKAPPVAPAPALSQGLGGAGIVVPPALDNDEGPEAGQTPEVAPEAGQEMMGE